MGSLACVGRPLAAVNSTLARVEMASTQITARANISPGDGRHCPILVRFRGQKVSALHESHRRRSSFPESAISLNYFSSRSLGCNLTTPNDILSFGFVRPLMSIHSCKAPGEEGRKFISPKFGNCKQIRRAHDALVAADFPGRKPATMRGCCELNRRLRRRSVTRDIGAGPETRMYPIVVAVVL